MQLAAVDRRYQLSHLSVRAIRVQVRKPFRVNVKPQHLVGWLVESVADVDIDFKLVKDPAIDRFWKGDRLSCWDPRLISARR